MKKTTPLRQKTTSVKTNKRKIYFYVALCAYVLVFYIFNIIAKQTLTVDETQYWSWSSYLQAGYHSKPPLIAFYIYAIKNIFGNLAWQLKTLQPVINAMISFIVYRAALLLYEEKVAITAALYFLLTCFAFSLTSTNLSTESLNLLFGSLAIYYIIQIYVQPKLYHWFALGTCIGLASLANYNGVYFLLYFILCLFFIKKLRTYLFKIYPYYTLLLFALVMAPNIIWNYHHGFITFRHVELQNISVEHYHRPSIFHFIAFIIQQPGIFSFIPFFVYVGLLFKKSSWLNEKSRLLILCSLPVLILISIQAFSANCKAYWSYNASVAAIIVATAFIYKHKCYRLIRLNYLISLLILLFFMSVEVAIYFNAAPYSLVKSLNLLQYTVNWQASSHYFNKLKMQYPTYNWLFDRREIWAHSLYVGKLDMNKIYFWNVAHTINHDSLTSNQSTLNKNFIYLTYFKTLPAYIVNHTQSYSVLPNILLKYKNHTFKTIYVYRLINTKNFQHS